MDKTGDTTVRVQMTDGEPTVEPWTTHYVLSILVNIFCMALPCAVIGTMHIIAARADAVRGMNFLAMKKKRQAICWTAWAFGIGIALIIIRIVLVYVAIDSSVDISKLQSYMI